jgi:hypothetical protein
MGSDVTSPLHHEGVAPGDTDGALVLLADRVQKARKAKWVRTTQRLHPDRFKQWVLATGDARTSLEEAWDAEDRAAEDAQKRARQEEGERRQRVLDARQRLRG